MAPVTELDLRHYLDAVRDSGGRSAWLSVGKSISPRFETTALVQQLARKMRNPVIQFESVDGCDLPMVSNVCCAYERVAKASGTTGDELQSRLTRAVDEPVKPVVLAAADAPVRERGADLTPSLKELPQLFYTETQTHPYITSALIVARDPKSGAHNVSFHRLMITSDEAAAIYMTPGGHLDAIWRQNAASDNPTPVAIVIGAHPLWCYGALAAGPLHSDDWGVVGGVLDEPLAVTGCKIDEDLMVPARAEMVFEGMIEPGQSQLESPFGEFLGYVAEPDYRPLIRIEHSSSRNDPIFQDIVAGESEHQTMSSVGLRTRLSRSYVEPNPAVTGFWLPAAMTLFLSIDQEADPAFDRLQFLRELLKAEKYIKHVICFDEEVDLRKQASVQSAIACNVQSDRDVSILADMDGNGVDPSEAGDRTSKMAIDACAKKHAVKNSLPASVLDDFNLSEWLD